MELLSGPQTIAAKQQWNQELALMNQNGLKATTQLSLLLLCSDRTLTV